MFKNNNTFRDSDFTNNKAVTGGGIIILGGDSTNLFSNCTFESNTANMTGVLSILGGGSNNRFEDCKFDEHNNGSSGGAVYVAGGKSTNFSHCNFTQELNSNNQSDEEQHYLTNSSIIYLGQVGLDFTNSKCSVNWYPDVNGFNRSESGPAMELCLRRCVPHAGLPMLDLTDACQFGTCLAETGECECYGKKIGIPLFDGESCECEFS